MKQVPIRTGSLLGDSFTAIGLNMMESNMREKGEMPRWITRKSRELLLSMDYPWTQKPRSDPLRSDPLRSDPLRPFEEFMDRHPGGPTTIVAWAGKDVARMHLGLGRTWWGGAGDEAWQPNPRIWDT